MVAKATNGDAKTAKDDKQGDLPGMEQKRHPKIHPVAEQYRREKLRLRKQTKKVEELGDRLLTLMREAKREGYRCEGLVVTVETGTKIKVTEEVGR